MVLLSYDAFTDSNSISPGHAENQDSFLGEKDLFAVADGVGGYRGGKEASSIAIAVLRERRDSIVDENSMRNTLVEIHHKVQESSQKLRFFGMGTTVAAAKVLPNSQGGVVVTGNVGDSPILLLRGGEVIEAYTDDSARKRDPRDLWSLTQYLGLHDEETDERNEFTPPHAQKKLLVEFHTMTLKYESGDILLLCSDGITDNLVPGDDFSLLSELVKREKSAKLLVKRAMDRGVKSDDMTAVLISL